MAPSGGKDKGNKVIYDPGWNETFVYDATGNLLNRVEGDQTADPSLQTYGSVPQVSIPEMMRTSPTARSFGKEALVNAAYGGGAMGGALLGGGFGAALGGSAASFGADRVLNPEEDVSNTIKETLINLGLDFLIPRTIRKGVQIAGRMHRGYPAELEEIANLIEPRRLELFKKFGIEDATGGQLTGSRVYKTAENTYAPEQITERARGQGKLASKKLMQDIQMLPGTGYAGTHAMSDPEGITTKLIRDAVNAETGVIDPKKLRAYWHDLENARVKSPTGKSISNYNMKQYNFSPEQMKAIDDFVDTMEYLNENLGTAGEKMALKIDPRTNYVTVAPQAGFLQDVVPGAAGRSATVFTRGVIKTLKRMFTVGGAKLPPELFVREILLDPKKMKLATTLMKTPAKSPRAKHLMNEFMGLMGNTFVDAMRYVDISGTEGTKKEATASTTKATVYNWPDVDLEENEAGFVSVRIKDPAQAKALVGKAWGFDDGDVGEVVDYKAGKNGARILVQLQRK